MNPIKTTNMVNPVLLIPTEIGDVFVGDSLPVDIVEFVLVLDVDDVFEFVSFGFEDVVVDGSEF
jgi:hypothetical protein